MVNELKLAYREAWLAENRPYWLENVLVRYEHEALYWHRLARKFADVHQQFRTEKTLSDPVSLGLHLP